MEQSDEVAAALRQIGGGKPTPVAHSQRRDACTASTRPWSCAPAGTLRVPIVAITSRTTATVLVAVGGGEVIAGIAAWFEGRVRVVGVETQGTACMAAALANGEPVDVDVGGIGADALGARRVCDLCFATARKLVDRIVVVDDDDVRAQRELWQRLRLLVEPAGAAAPAALISRAYRPEPRERVGVLLWGGQPRSPQRPRLSALAQASL